MEQVDLKSDLLGIFKNNVNVPGLAADLIDGIGEPALRAAVAKSETKLDDIVLMALYQPLEDEIKKLIKQKWEELFQAGDGEPV